MHRSFSRSLKLKHAPVRNCSTLTNKELSRTIRNIFGFSPGNVDLYRLALKHKSAAQEVIKGLKNCNERLEYLGDAVLSIVVADFLFHRYPFKDEGFLTEMRSKMVSRPQLNKLSQKLGIDKLIEADQEATSTCRSMAGDAFEAFVGAVYLDKGYKTVKKVILERVVKYHFDLEDIESRELNFKSRIIEWSQREKRSLEFRVAEEQSRGARKLYIIEVVVDKQPVARGQGYTIKEAEQSGAEIAAGKLIPEEA